MRKILFGFSFQLFVICTSAQPPSDPRLQGFESVVLKVLKDWHTPGVSIAIVEKNKIVYAGGFGYRDMEKKLPVTENTQFNIASCTKAFTAAIIGILEEANKLSIDKPAI